MRTRDLLELRNTGHPGINALFAKAHSADWDFERDVDWTVPVAPDDPLVDARLGRLRSHRRPSSRSPSTRRYTPPGARSAAC